MIIKDMSTKNGLAYRQGFEYKAYIIDGSTVYVTTRDALNYLIQHGRVVKYTALTSDRLYTVQREKIA